MDPATVARLVACAMAAALLPLPSGAQVQTEVPAAEAGARPVTVERVKVRGASLDGNLEGNAVERDVLVFLPESYGKDPARRYPVVYALHGYSIGAEQWSREIHAPQTIEGAFARGAREMIVVLPDSKTAHNGSMYSSSVTTGDFERFIARDLVAWIDLRYRTLARRESRGLVGHSMGGYGSTRIGMKHADVFGSLYIMSPCCLSARGTGPNPAEFEKTVAAMTSPADSAKLPFFPRTQLAVASAWSPNPKSPPLFLDLPTKDGVAQPDVVARWAANAPLAFIDQYMSDLGRYAAIAIDVGDEDRLKADSEKLQEVLSRNAVASTLEIYKGNHTNRVADRLQNHVLPFFSRTLAFDAGAR